MLQIPQNYIHTRSRLSGINKLRLPEYSNVILIRNAPGGLPTPFRYAWGGQISGYADEHSAEPDQVILIEVGHLRCSLQKSGTTLKP